MTTKPEAPIVVEFGDDVEFTFPRSIRPAGVTRLVTAAKAVGSSVRVDTGGLTRRYHVSRAVAAAAGYLDDDGAQDDKPAAPEPAVEAPTVPADETEPAPEVTEPPRHSKGSTKAAWRTFLEEQGIAYAETDTRDDLISLWDNRDAATSE